jgi:hypothetical protein
MRLQEGLPRHTLASLWRRLDAVLREDAPDGISTDNVTDVAKRAADAGVAPGWIRFRHREDKLADSLGGAGTTRTAPLAAVILLGNQLSIPAKDRVRGDNAAKLAQRRSPDCLPLLGQATPLTGCEANPLPVELLPEDSVLLSQVLDDVALVAVRPACEDH